MKREWVLRQKAFDTFLAWLDADRDLAGEKYEEIRRKLIANFRHRGCLNPEELTDEVINHVIRKVPEIAGTYTGDPALYFYAVAHKVFMANVWKGTRRDADSTSRMNRRGTADSSVPGVRKRHAGAESRELSLTH